MFSSELSLPSCLLDDLDTFDADFDHVAVGEEEDDGVIRGVVTEVNDTGIVLKQQMHDNQEHYISKTKAEIGHETVQIGDKVAFKPNGGPLIIAPDYLLPATLLADSFTCMRRACLSALTQPAVEDNRPSTSLVIGSLVHTVIQSLLSNYINSVDL